MHCARRGCTRKLRTDRFTHCCTTCRDLDRQTADAHRIRENLGPSDLTDGYLTAVEDLAAALNRTNHARTQLRSAALEAGWTADQFAGLLAGTITVATQ